MFNKLIDERRETLLKLNEKIYFSDLAYHYKGQGATQVLIFLINMILACFSMHVKT